MPSSEPSEDELASARAEADQQIKATDDTIELFVTGLRQFQYFNPGTDRVERIATTIQMLSGWSQDPETELDRVLLLAATAVVKLADMESASLPEVAK